MFTSVKGDCVFSHQGVLTGGWWPGLVQHTWQRFYVCCAGHGIEFAQTMIMEGCLSNTVPLKCCVHVCVCQQINEENSVYAVLCGGKTHNLHLECEVVKTHPQLIIMNT